MLGSPIFGNPHIPGNLRLKAFGTQTPQTLLVDFEFRA